MLSLAVLFFTACHTLQYTLHFFIRFAGIALEAEGTFVVNYSYHIYRKGI